jgi:hypothetical protein
MKSQRRLAGLTLLAGCCLLTALAPPAVSGDDKLTRKEKEARDRAEANGQVIVQLTLANDLFEEAFRNNSPLALVAAAEILRKLKDDPRPVKAEPIVEGARPAPGTEEKPAEISPKEQSVVYLAEAVSMAKRMVRAKEMTEEEAAAVRTLTQQVANIPIKRGAKGGPQQRSGFLAPGATHVYRIDFDGLGTEYVRVFGNNKTTLKVSIANSRGVLRGVDTGTNPGGTWSPDGPGNEVYTIRIANIGNAGTTYRLMTN